MNNSEIFIFAAVLIAVGIRLYMRYFKKDNAGSDKKLSPGSHFTSSSKEDDYEPYSKK
jgi:hypothetical protein